MPYLLIFYRLILRPWRKEALRTLLTAAAVGLGVSVVLAIEMAGEAAAGSFQSSLETLSGDSDLEVTATGGVPARVVAELATSPYPLEIRPRMEDYASVLPTRQTVAVIGVDVLTDFAARAPAGNPDEGFDTSGDSVFVGPALQRKVGDRLRLVFNDREREFVVRGVLPKEAQDIVVMDLAVAARAMGRADGSLDRILIRTPKSGSQGDWMNTVRGLLPRGVSIAPFGSKTNENRRMLEAFRWNLRVLSYIALIVGAFLIYNTISVSVVRRRAEVGIVRALGATRTAVVGAFLAEGACFGVAGAIVGTFLGKFLAEGAVGMVAMTVQTLYVSSRPSDIELSWQVILFAFLIAIGVAIASAFAPSLEAARIPPIAALARGSREHAVRIHAGRQLAIASVFGLVAFLASQQAPVGGKPLFGYLSAVCMIAAAAFAIPSLVATVCRFLASALGRWLGVEAMLAARSLVASLRRTSVLVGALTTAIAMTAAVGIMVGSFRETVLLWMDDRLQADLYLRPAGPIAPDHHPVMTADTGDLLRALPQVAAVDEFRAYRISYNGGPVTLAGAQSRVAGSKGRRAFLSGAQPKAIFERLGAEPDTVIVSEPFANKHGVRAGQTLQLTLGGKPAIFRVLDVYFDYSSERGYILMDRKTLLKYLPDPAPSNVAVYLKEGVTLEEGRQIVQSALAGRKVMVFSNRSIRAEAIRTFDQTFAVTYALEAIAVVVAIMGVAGALLALVIDRRREFALLRFLGGARSQVRRLVLFEAAILGMLSNAAGVVLGFVLSLLLIFVINKQSFGWTIQFHWPIAALLGALTVVYLATVVCAVYPARVAAGLRPVEVLNDE